jgi:hypothetical protein
MTDKIKMNKKDIINSINVHYLKQGVLCGNIYKLSKDKLLTILNDNNIEYISKDQLKEDILNIEKYNNLRDIIYCNFIKYENISYDIISKITTTTTIEELEAIISKNNLKYEDNFHNDKELIFNLFKIYDSYCKSSSINNNCKFITLPNIINSLKEIIKSP